jgi:MYXO-CTERM domain-containing protein
MMPVRRLLFPALAATLGLACSNGASERASTIDSAPPGVAREAIVGGTTASMYPEAALIELLDQGQVVAACSGSVIAPKVVLTAGHCVTGTNGWRVTAPYANKQTAVASGGMVFDYTSQSDYVEPTQHDVGLVFLATPIQLTQYPSIATKPVADGTNVVNIGRIQDGQLSNTDLFVSRASPVQDASGQGFPFDYTAADIIESGDSGGPDEILNVTPHMIVAVNSGGGGGGGEVLARVDLVSAWITTQIQSHGGLPTQAGADAGAEGGTDAGSSTGSSGSTDTPPPPSHPSSQSTSGGGNADSSKASPSHGTRGLVPTSGSGCSVQSTTRGASSNGIVAALALAAIAAFRRRRR